MRKVIIGLAAAIVVFGACSAEAQHRHYHGGGGHRSGGGWVAPLVGGLIVGGVVGSVLSQPSYASPPPVYVEQPRYRRCWEEPMFDRYTGRYIGDQRVCQAY